MGVLDATIRYGVSLSRSVGHSSVGQDPCCWSFISSAVWGLGIGDFYRAVSDVHHRLSVFIHAVVVHRRDEDPMVHPFQWLRPDLVPPAPFLQCKPHLTPCGSGVLADPARIDEEFRKAWAPLFLSLWTKGYQP